MTDIIMATLLLQVPFAQCAKHYRTVLQIQAAHMSVLKDKVNSFCLVTKAESQ